MTIDVYSSDGQKKSTLELPVALFEDSVNWGLMHQAVLLQQGNRRAPIAHAKNRGEMAGSTRKLYAQKHTGQARRGPIRSPLLRGGGKAFGPRNTANFSKDMPKKMRHAALRSCLSLQAKKGGIVGLESYPDTVKTKDLAQLLKKMPVESGRRTLIVLPAAHRGLQLSARNVPGVKTVHAAYLNPEDVLNARHVIFLVESIEIVQKIFAKQQHDRTPKKTENADAPAATKTPKTKTAKNAKNPKAAKKPAAKTNKASSADSPSAS